MFKLMHTRAWYPLRNFPHTHTPRLASICVGSPASKAVLNAVKAQYPKTLLPFVLSAVAASAPVTSPLPRCRRSAGRGLAGRATQVPGWDEGILEEWAKANNEFAVSASAALAVAAGHSGDYSPGYHGATACIVQDII